MVCSNSATAYTYDSYTLSGVTQYVDEVIVADRSGGTGEVSQKGNYLPSLSNYSEVTVKNNKTITSLLIEHPDWTHTYYTVYSNADTYGGAVYCNSSLTLSNNGTVTFSGNRASAYAGATSEEQDELDGIELNASAEAYGGAIYLSSGSLQISRNNQVSFVGNSAIASTPEKVEDEHYRQNGQGGAIACMNGDVIISYNNQLIFDDNRASYCGAAIYAQTGNIILQGNTNLIISDNDTYAFYATKGAITLQNSVYVEATGNSNGVFHAPSLTISDCGSVNFSNNTSSNSSYDGNVYGGGTLTMNNNSSIAFTKNVSTLSTRTLYSKNSLSMNNNHSITFSENESEVSGTSIYWYSNTSAQNNDCIQLKNNATITFSKNKIDNTYTRVTSVDYYDLDISKGGTCLLAEDSYTKHAALFDLSDNGKVIIDGNSVTLKGSVDVGGTPPKHNYVYALCNMSISGTAMYLYAMQTEWIGNGSITFSNNNAKSTATAFGNSITTETTPSSSYDFSNMPHATASVDGGALSVVTIHTDIWSNNDIISFLSNTSTVSASASYYAGAWVHGGALYRGSTGQLLVEDNKEIIFKGNKSSSSATGTENEAGILGYYQPDGYYYGSYQSANTMGGAIYQNSGSSIIFAGNDRLSFEDNSLTARADNSVYISPSVQVYYTKFGASTIASGGALYCTGAETILQDNAQVLFTGNSVSGTATLSANSNAEEEYSQGVNAKVQGGAISIVPDSGSYGNEALAAILNITGNSEVIFSGNTISASASKTSSTDSRIKVYCTAEGGAIYVGESATLSVCGNSSVIFEKNTERKNDVYQLRSIYSNGTVNLAANAGDDILFYDPITSEGSKSELHLNRDYTNQQGYTIQSEGNIIISGAYTEQHLKEMMKKMGTTRSATSAELAASRTSYVETAHLYNGFLCIQDSAILSGRSLTLHAATGKTPTLVLNNGQLDYSSGTITCQSGSVLQLQGSNAIAVSTLSMESGSCIYGLLSDVNKSNSLATISGTLAITDGVHLKLDADGTMLSNGTYMLLSMSNKPNNWNTITIDTAFDFQLRWVGNTLMADFCRLDWNNATGTRIWDSTSRNWSNGSTSVAYSSGDTVYFTDTASGQITLKGNLSPGLMWVENSTGKNYTFTGTGQLSGSMQLQKYGQGVLTISSNNSYTGGTIIQAGKLVAGSDTAFGTGNIELHQGILDINGKSLANDITASGGTIYGGSAYNGRLYVEGDVQLADSLTTLQGIELKHGSISGGVIRNTPITINSSDFQVSINSTLAGSCSISLDSGSLKTGTRLDLADEQTLSFNGGQLNNDLLIHSGSSVELTADATVNGNVTFAGGTLSYTDYFRFDVTGNVSLNTETLIEIAGNYELDRPYILISAGGTMDVDFSKLTGISTTMGDRYACRFGVDNNNLTVTLEEVGYLLKWAGGPEGIWEEGGGVWDNGAVFTNGDSVIFSDGTIYLKGELNPATVYLRPTGKLTFKSYDKYYSWNNYITGEETCIVVEAGPNAKVYLPETSYHRGGTIIRSGTVITTDYTSFGYGPITLAGGTLDFASNWINNDLILTGTASIKNGKYFYGRFVMTDGELLKGSKVSSYDIELQGGTVSGEIKGPNGISVTTGSVTIGASGKLVTDYLNIADGGRLNITSKGLSMNKKTSEIHISESSSLESAGKLSAYSLTINGGEMYVIGAKPIVLTFGGAADLLSGAILHHYGAFTASELNMSDGSTFTLGTNAAPTGSKPQKLTLKDKTATSTITDSQLTINGSMNTAGSLWLADSQLSLRDAAVTPKAQGLSVKGELTMEQDSYLSLTGKLSAGSLQVTDSTITLHNSTPQGITLSGKNVTNTITGSLLNINGSMNVTGNLSLGNQSQIFMHDTGKGKAMNLKVKGDLTLGSLCSLTLSGSLSAGNLLLEKGSTINLTSSKCQTIKASKTLTINENIDLNLCFSVPETATNKTTYKLFTYKTSNIEQDTDLHTLLGLDKSYCTLTLDTKKKAITLQVTDWQAWEAYVAENIAAIDKSKPAVSTLSAEDVVGTETPVTDMLPEQRMLKSAVIDEYLGKVSDSLVQATWGTANASRAFVNSLANRQQNTTKLTDGQSAVWGSVIGTTGRISSHAGHSGADHTLHGAALGAEMNITPQNSLGLAMGETWGKVSTFSAHKIDQDNTHFAIYGKSRLTGSPDRELALDWSTAYALGENEANISGTNYEWNRNALQLDARLSYACALSERTSVRGFGAVQYLHVDSATPSQGIESDAMSNLRLELGAGATHLVTEKTALHGELSLFGDMLRDNPESYIGGRYRNGSNPGHTGMNLNMGATHKLNEHWNLHAEYNMELQPRSGSHSIDIGATYCF